MHLHADQYVPQTGSSRGPLAMWSFLTIGSLLLVGLIIGAPVALAFDHETLANTIYLSFGHLCHQIPQRSFFIAGNQFAVCSRCTGVYSGFTVASLAYPLVKSLRQTEAPDRKWLFLGAAPLAIDFGLEFLNIWHNTHFSRFVTGALLGAVAVFYVMPGLAELSLRDWRGRPGRPSAPTGSQAGLSGEAFPTRVSSGPSDYSAPHRRI